MDFVKKYAYVFLGVFCVLALGALFMANRDRPAGVMDLGQPIGGPRQEASPPPQSGPEATGSEPGPAIIVVHIVGAVYSPGVFEVPYGSRINCVLQLAGGYTYEADVALINLAAFVQDATQIRIPFIGEEPQFPISQGAAQGAIAPDGRVNINLANLTELQTLPGIGPTRAQSIIDFRDAAGGFNSIEELINVHGIGSTILDNIRERITV